MRLRDTSAPFAALLCLTAAACGGSDDKKDNGTKPVQLCTPNLIVGCGDVPAADVNNQKFVAGLGNATCAADGSAWDTSKCTAMVMGTKSEGDRCDPSGDECTLGLTCVKVYAGTDSSGDDLITGLCQYTCSTAADCSSGGLCEPVWALSTTVCSAPGGSRDQVCGYGHACDPALDCVSTTAYGQECKQVCQSTDDCTPGEKCLQTGTLELQNASTDGVDCADDTGCDQANGYFCYIGNSGSGLCMRVPTACGKELAPLTDLSQAGKVLSGQACGYPGTSQFCGPLTNGGTAQVTCTTNGWGAYSEYDKNNKTVSCTSDADCSFDIGYSCFTFDNGTAKGVQRCAITATVCVAYCEDGFSVPKGDCGTGLTCAAPPGGDFFNPDIDSVARQPDAINPTNVQACTQSADCDSEYACVQFSNGQFCVRPRKICQLDNTPPGP